MLCFIDFKEQIHNVVAVGDSDIGKSALMSVLKDGKVSKDDLPEYYQTFTHKIKVDGKKLELGLWDTAGEATYEGLRRLSYPTASVFLVCYSVNSRESFENIRKVWFPEIHRHGPPNVPIVIVGTKQDLRPRTSLIPNGSDNQLENGFVKYDEGLALADCTGASSYVECTVTNENTVLNVFENAARAVLQYAKEQKKIKGRRGSGK